MRILFCMNCLYGRGGIERVTIVKANALAEIPGNQIAICYTDKGDYSETIHPLNPKIKTYFLDTPYWDLTSLRVRNVFIDFPRKVLSTKKAIEQVIEDFNPDILVNTGSYEKYACAIIKSKSKHTKGKYIKKIREFHFTSNYRILTSKSILSKLAARGTFVFEKYILCKFFNKSYLLTKRDLRDNYKGYIFNKWAGSLIDYQYNPHSFNESSSHYQSSDRRKIVLAVGRVCYQKNFEELIEIWAKIYNDVPDWTLRIVGGTPSEVEYLKNFAKQKGCQNSIECPGWSKDVESEMRNASILCMTSRYEGFGLVLVEAMHCGLPVISYDLPCGPSEIIDDDESGYLISYGNKQEFADKLLDLLKNQKKVENMRSLAIKKSLEYTPNKIANEWMKKYKEL